MTNLIGKSLGRYHILEQLGEGGMATVYKAYDTSVERDVAIKVIRTDQFVGGFEEQALTRFKREAKALTKLNHPNIVTVYDFGQFGNILYLVMEYIPEGTLKEKLTIRLPWRKAFKLLLPIANALGFAHSQGIIHRDVKPDNILISPSGEPLLSDFGIAKILDVTEENTITLADVGVGTPEYMAPEQGVGKKMDSRADIYSFGV
ncbi:MAG: serine/threonine protein kinase, partial [Deltaproteobacteria bacterium]|nr:serine/threonine protein kinase [Deltaproteobacteria bacterium]